MLLWFDCCSPAIRVPKTGGAKGLQVELSPSNWRLLCSCRDFGVKDSFDLMSVVCATAISPVEPRPARQTGVDGVAMLGGSKSCIVSSGSWYSPCEFPVPSHDHESSSGNGKFSPDVAPCAGGLPTVSWGKWRRAISFAPLGRILSVRS